MARKSEFKTTWPKHNKYLTPDDIRKHLEDDACDEYFPRPFKWQNSNKKKRTKWIDRPIQEKDLFAFYNRTHQFLHEQNPYKVSWEDRAALAPGLLQEAFDKLRVLWKLFALHQRVSKLDTGEKHLMMSQFMADGSVKVCSILKDDE